jgi:hypothetical protein
MAAGVVSRGRPKLATVSISPFVAEVFINEGYPFINLFWDTEQTLIVLSCEVHDCLEIAGIGFKSDNLSPGTQRAVEVQDPSTHHVSFRRCLYHLVDEFPLLIGKGSLGAI